MTVRWRSAEILGRHSPENEADVSGDAALGMAEKAYNAVVRADEQVL